MTARKRGRPLKLTKPLIKDLCKFVAIGCTLKDCCSAVGIHYYTFHGWQVKGEKLYTSGVKPDPENKIYFDLIDEFHRAEFAYKMVLLSTIRRNIPNNPALALQVLERRYPDEWGRKYRSDTDSLKDEGIRITFHRVTAAPPTTQEGQTE